MNLALSPQALLIHSLLSLLMITSQLLKEKRRKRTGISPSKLISKTNRRMNKRRMENKRMQPMNLTSHLALAEKRGFQRQGKPKTKTGSFMDSIASWNIRGAHLSLKQQEIKHLIASYKLNMVGILETKLDSNLTSKAVSFINPNWLSSDNLPSLPYGRILVIWNPTVFHAAPLSSSAQFIHLNVTHLTTNQNFHITFVYAFNSKVPRAELLSHLPNLNPSPCRGFVWVTSIACIIRVKKLAVICFLYVKSPH